MESYSREANYGQHCIPYSESCFSQLPSCTSKRIGDGTKVWSEAPNATANHNGTIGGLLADNRHCHYSHIAKRSRRYTLGPITLSGRYFIQHFGIMSPDQSPEVSTESLLPRKVKALPPPLEVDIPASSRDILFLKL